MAFLRHRCGLLALRAQREKQQRDAPLCHGLHEHTAARSQPTRARNKVDSETKFLWGI